MATHPMFLPESGIAVSGMPAAWAMPSAGLSDAGFLDQLRAQEADAFTIVYEQYKTQIYSYLLRLSGSVEIADDLTHDTFLSAYEALPRLKTDSAVSAWLYRIASNRFRDLLRRKKIIHWFSMTDRKDVEDSMSHDGDQERVPERELVQSALRELKPDYRICLTLRLVEGFSTDETAVIMKTSPESVRMRLCRARQMFKAAYVQAEQGAL